MFRLFNKYYSLEDSETITPPTGPKSDDKDDIIEFLGEDDSDDKALDLTTPKIKSKTDDETEIKEEDEEDDTEKEEDELDLLVEETEEPSDEQLELTTPVRRREILKKYPTLFKDFPYLERAYYREQQFTDVFATIDDAKRAAESVETLSRFENDLLTGNNETILKSVRDANPNAFYKIVDNYLPTLAKVDEKAYQTVLGNTIKYTIVAMLNEAKKSNNDVLQSAAQILNQFAFGSSDFQPPSKLAKDDDGKPDERTTELQRREQQFTRQQFTTTQSDLNTRVNNSLTATIEANIDPRDSMNDYVKKNAIREANETLSTLISGDRRFREIIDKLWEKAFKDGFTQESKDRIRSAYLSKAKTLLPSVIKKARNEALRGMGKRVTEDKEETTIKGVNKSEQPRSKSSGKITKPQDIPKGMRTIDFLMQD